MRILPKRFMSKRLKGIAWRYMLTSWLSLSRGVALLAFFIEFAGVRCFGSGGTLLRGMRCSGHRSAKRTLSSYTLTTAIALSVRGKPVHCPYCGMSCNMFRPGVSSRDSAGNLELTTGGRRPTKPPRPAGETG